MAVQGRTVLVLVADGPEPSEVLELQIDAPAVEGHPDLLLGEAAVVVEIDALERLTRGPAAGVGSPCHRKDRKSARRRIARSRAEVWGGARTGREGKGGWRSMLIARPTLNMLE